MTTNNVSARSKAFTILLKASIITLFIFVSWKILEYVSYKILVSKGMLPEDGIIKPGLFETKLSLWQGGLDNAADGYFFQGYNESLKLGNITYSDQYGFYHGDSLPLQKNKPNNSIRIILTGGSGMKGCLQTWSLIKMFDYPQGCYDYETSIAGKLKQILTKRHPNIKWEVINAAVVMHQFNQSMAEYYEKIHDLNPDIIINMDGYNDLWISLDFINKGDPFLNTYSQASQGIELEMLKRSAQFGYTYMLLNNILLRKEEEKSKEPEIKSVLKNTSVNDLTSIAKASLMDINPDKKIERDSFKCIMSYMKANMSKQLWLISSYENQLKHDGIYSIFCLQPMLAREKNQKKLSVKEVTMLNQLNKLDMENIALKVDVPLILGKNNSDAQQLIECFNQSGESRYYVRKYNNTFFINDYISPAIDSIIKLYDASYIDLGSKMTNIPDNVEFYLDYTHTTPFGNQFIAEEMAKEVYIYLEKKETIQTFPKE